MGMGHGGDTAWLWVGTFRGVPRCFSEPWLLYPWGLTRVRLVVIYEPVLELWWPQRVPQHRCWEEKGSLASKLL